MAPSLPHPTTTITLTILLLHILLAPATSLPWDTDDEPEVYTLDAPLNNVLTRSHHITKRIRKGAHCVAGAKNICDGVSANNGTSLLYCCKTHCRNVLGDRNNCGKCGSKCKFGELCCHGKCISVAYDANNCGKCDKKCGEGVKCEYGSCGYA